MAEQTKGQKGGRRTPADGQGARTRRDQIEGEFLRRLKSKLKRDGITLAEAQLDHVREFARSAAIAGAVEERERALGILRANPQMTARDVDNLITLKGVLQVLGYE